MPPSLTSFRTCAFRPRPRGAIPPLRPSNLAFRSITEKNNPDQLPKAGPGEAGPNTQQQEHVSEEAAKMAQIQGQEGPDMSQGTPVHEIVQDEKEQQDHAPQVLKEEAQNGGPTGSASIKPSNTPSGTRSFSTSVRRRLELESAPTSPPPIDAYPSSFLSFPPTSTSTTTTSDPPEPLRSTVRTTAGPQTGHKFPLPSIPTIPTKPNTLKRTRQNTSLATQAATPLLPQLTNLLMRDGKKARAERTMHEILTYLRTLPAPTLTTTRPLIANHPPAAHLVLNPIAYLTLALDSVAPLMRIRSQRGAAGGGVALQIPVPLGLRQRRRTAFTWILDAASKRPNRGSGREMLALRVANEIVGVVEGRSGVWEKRAAVHRLAMAARTNVGWSGRGFRR